MGNPFRSTLLVIHVIGGMIAFVVFSYQYATEHGFFSWFLFGEITPVLKSIVWEVFLVMAFLGSSSLTTDNSLSKQEFWWQSEYPALVKAVGAAGESGLIATFQTGPDARSQVDLSLRTLSSNSLTLLMDLPREALPGVEPETGGLIPNQVRPLLVMMDNDLDGMLDVFKVEPSGELTGKEFITFSNSAANQNILMPWSIGIGFSINHFLHGIDSAMPR